MKQRRPIRFFFLLIIISLLLFLGEKTIGLGIGNFFDRIFIPWQSGIYTFGQNISENFESLKYWKSNRRKLENLEQRNRELLVKAAKADALEEENKSLREQLNVDLANERNYVLAKVIGSRVNFKINKGKRDGIKTGSGVILKDFLVGKVRDVNESSSLVEVTTDSHSKVEVVDVNTNARGIVRGQFGSGLVLDSVLQEERLDIGDVLVTSGENGLYPEGLVVGKITGIRKNESEVFQKANVELLVNLAQIREVFVVKE